MAAFRRTWTGLVLGSAIFALPLFGQQSSSVSLTHTVSVTVPPRVKVQVGSLATPNTAATSTGAISISVNATQSWILSIGSAQSKVQWSTSGSSDFAGVTAVGATIASGGISQRPADATLYLRNLESAAQSGVSHAGASDAVMLTVVAP